MTPAGIEGRVVENGKAYGDLVRKFEGSRPRKDMDARTVIVSTFTFSTDPLP
jgi:hypothetical protein